MYVKSILCYSCEKKQFASRFLLFVSEKHCVDLCPCAASLQLFHVVCLREREGGRAGHFAKSTHTHSEIHSPTDEQEGGQLW